MLVFLLADRDGSKVFGDRRPSQAAKEGQECVADAGTERKCGKARVVRIDAISVRRVVPPGKAFRLADGCGLRACESEKGAEKEDSVFRKVRGHAGESRGRRAFEERKEQGFSLVVLRVGEKDGGGMKKPSLACQRGVACSAGGSFLPLPFLSDGDRGHDNRRKAECAAVAGSCTGYSPRAGLETMVDNDSTAAQSKLPCHCARKEGECQRVPAARTGYEHKWRAGSGIVDSVARVEARLPAQATFCESRMDKANPLLLCGIVHHRLPSPFDYVDTCLFFDRSQCDELAGQLVHGRVASGPGVPLAFRHVDDHGIDEEAAVCAQNDA